MWVSSHDKCLAEPCCLYPCRLLVWYWVGSADRKTWRICVWSSLFQLPAQIWSVCSTLPCPEVCFLLRLSQFLLCYVYTYCFGFCIFTLHGILKVKRITFISVTFSISKKFSSVIREINWGIILTLPVMWLLSYFQNWRPERCLRQWQIYGEESPPSNQ